MKKLALVIMPGGMSNAFSVGAISGAQLSPNDVDIVVASSSGAGVGAFFVSGQLHLAEQIFVEQLIKPEIYSLFHLLKGRRPYDVDYLIDHCCRDLSVEGLAVSSTTLYAGVFRRNDGKTVHKIVSPENWRSVLKATGAVPILARPVKLDDGQYYVDGGIEETQSIQFAYDLGYRRIILISNKPLQLEYAALTITILFSWLVFPWWRAARAAFRNSRTQNIRAFTKSLPVDMSLYLICPAVPLRSNWLSRSKEIVQRAHDIGLAIGVEQRARLRVFSRNDNREVFVSATT